MVPSLDTPSGVRVLALRALAFGLCVAGLAGVLALLTGSFGPDDARVVVTSFGFGLFSLTASAGVAFRLRPAPRAPALGALAAGSSAVAFLLLLAILWGDTARLDPPETLVRAGVLALIVAIWSAHGCVVLGARRDDDPPAVRGATFVALVALGFDAVAASLGTLGVLDRAQRESGARAFAAVLIVALVATTLVPILRRLRPTTVADPVPGPSLGTDLSRTVSSAGLRVPGLAAMAAVAGLVAGLAIGGARTPAARTVTDVVAAAPPAAVAAAPAAANGPGVPPAALREAEGRLMRRVAARHPDGDVTVACRADSPPAVLCDVRLQLLSTAPQELETGAIYDPDRHRVVRLDTSAP